MLHSSSKALDRDGKIVFYSHFAEAATLERSGWWGRGRGRIRPQGWAQALHPPAVPSTFSTRSHRLASLLEN